MEKTDKEGPWLAIGEVAAKLGVSVETIRLYERQGLLLVAKSEKGQRIYSDSDVSRLRCIRTAINEDKISIEGIRRMQSLIPCWTHIQCPEEQRESCPAFLRTSGGCWTYKHDNNWCAEIDCRTCKVYRLSNDCENIKSLIYRDMIPQTENHRQQENET